MKVERSFCCHSCAQPIRNIRCSIRPRRSTNHLPSIDITRDGNIATVAINNPGKLNALTVAMWRELARVMRELASDEDLRCIVLRGAGHQAFAAGADMTEFAHARNNFAQGKLYHLEYVAGALDAVGMCRHPTVALIQGPCAGGGLEFAIAYGELAGLLAVAGRAVAAEILLEGRMWTADEAFAKGLLTRVVPDEHVQAEAYASARRIADGAPLVARWHKRFIRRLTPQGAPLTEAEIDANFDYFDTEDYRIGYDAFINKKKPKFQGR